MRKRKATICPSCGRPVTDEAAQCPYCGEPVASGVLASGFAPWHFFASVLALAAALAALFSFPADWRTIAASAGEGFGIPADPWCLEALPAMSRALGALMLFLPLGHGAAGAPSPLRAGEVAAGAAWRLLLVADAAIGSAALFAAETAPGRLFGTIVLAGCLAACRLFRLGWTPAAAIVFIAAGGIC